MQPGKPQSSKRHRPHVPQEQRKRTVQACVQCRTIKKKCRPGSRNQCASCARSGQACVFQSIPKSQQEADLSEAPKGKNCPEYGSSPIPWAAMARDISNKFNKICPETSLEPYHFLILSKLFYEVISVGGQCLDSTSTSHWEEGSSHPSQLTRDAADLESTSSRLATNAVDDHILLSQKSFMAAVSEAIYPEHVSKGNTHSPIDESPSQVDVFGYQDDSRLVNGVTAKLPPYKDAESLVDVFFMYLESNWYYFDERWFRGLLVQLYQGTFPAPHIQCTTFCLVFLVLALGSSFMHLNQSTPAHLLGHDLALGELPGSNFYRVAIGLMPGVLAATSVESVQCCLLTALYILPTQNISHHYAYLGLALRLAISLSLHLDGTGSQIAPQEREIRTRVFWTVYCIERQISVVMGLPTMLQMRDITVPLPQRRRDLDELHPQKVDRLIVFAKLTLIMTKTTGTSSIKQMPDKFSWVCSTLENWKQSLSAHLVALDDTCLRANAHLDMMYQLAWIYIGRAPLLRLIQKRLHQTDSGRESDLTTNLDAQKLLEKCINAACTIIEWIGLLHSRNRLAKFSYTDVHFCSSAIVILLLNEVLHPQHLCSSAIEHGIDALRFIASGSRLAKDALHLVERLRADIHNPNRNDVCRTQELDGSRPQAHYTNAAEVPSPLPEGAEYTASDFATSDTALFSDLETSLLQYSSQNLALFGFDGFYPTVETNEFSWSCDSSVNAMLAWQTHPGL